MRWFGAPFRGVRQFSHWVASKVAQGFRKARAWFNPPYKTVIVDGELPKKLKSNVLYVLEEDGYQEQAAMRCPCRCDKVIHLNLLADERPCWQVTQHDDGTATLHPSVWRTKGCRSHFFFRKGRVVWVGSGISPNQTFGTND